MKLKAFIAYWFPVIAYMGLIFYLSSLPNSSFEGISTGFGINDKAEHFIEYFILGLLCFRLFRHYKKDYSSLKAVAISTFYGMADELHQLFVPTRVFSIGDLFFDFLGSLALVLIIYISNRVISALKKQLLVEIFCCSKIFF